MPDYRRLVSYMYTYEEGKKRNNVGYVRVESRNGQCRFIIHVSALSYGDRPVTIYGFRRYHGAVEGILLGRGVFKNGVLDARLITDPNYIAGTNYTIEDISGIVLYHNNLRYLATSWEEELITYEEVETIISGKPSTTSTVEIEDAVTESVVAESIVAESIVEESVVAASVVAESVEDVKSEIENEICDNVVSFESHTHLGEDKLDADKVSEEKISEVKISEVKISEEISEEKSEEKLEENQFIEDISSNLFHHTDPNMEAINRELEEVLYQMEEDSVQVLNTYPSDEPNDSMGEQVSATAWNGTDIEEEKVQKPMDHEPEICPRCGGSRGGNTNYSRNRNQRNSLGSRGNGGQQPRQNCPPNNNAPSRTKPIPPLVPHMEEPLIAQKLLNEFPRMHPFEDNQVIWCVKIEPKDIGVLPVEVWPLANNSFLLHGYYGHKHLIFAKVSSQHGNSYILGVPGIYHSREGFMAKMFGFENFKCSKHGEQKDGEFGYWFVPVRLV